MTAIGFITVFIVFVLVVIRLLKGIGKRNSSYDNTMKKEYEKRN